MENTICFRDFEERDIEFIYKYKNEAKLNEYTVGDWHPFTYQEAVKWVHGCMTDNPTFKFWAVATNDTKKRIVGWVSLAHIDYNSKSANFHGIVIGDPDYQDGSAWIECYQKIFDIVFAKMHFNELTGSHLSIHPSSGIIAECMFMTVYNVQKDAVKKNGKNADIIKVSIHKDDYERHLESGDYDFTRIQSRILKKYKNIRK